MSEVIKPQESREEKLNRLKQEYVRIRCERVSSDPDSDMLDGAAKEWEELLGLIQQRQPIYFEIAICLTDEMIDALGISDWDSSAVNDQAEAGEIVPPGYEYDEV